MIYKGCIVEIEKDWAFVMTEQACFYKIIKRKNMSVGKQIMFLDDDIYKEKNFRGLSLVKYAAVMVILIVSTLLLSQYVEYNKAIYLPAAVVSLDINPSIEFEIDQEYRLLRINSKNCDGLDLISDSMLRKDIKEVLYMAILNAKMENYITQDKNYVLIGISPLNDTLNLNFENFERNIDSQIKKDENLKDINIIYMQGDLRELDESRKSDLTIGKYKLYLKLISEDSNLILEDVKYMSVNELVTYSSQNRNRLQWDNKNGMNLDEEFNSKSENSVKNKNQYQYDYEYQYHKQYQNIETNNLNDNPNNEGSNQNNKANGLSEPENKNSPCDIEKGKSTDMNNEIKNTETVAENNLEESKNYDETDKESNTKKSQVKKGKK